MILVEAARLAQEVKCFEKIPSIRPSQLHREHPIRKHQAANPIGNRFRDHKSHSAATHYSIDCPFTPSSRPPSAYSIRRVTPSSHPSQSCGCHKTRKREPEKSRLSLHHAAPVHDIVINIFSISVFVLITGVVPVVLRDGRIESWVLQGIVVDTAVSGFDHSSECLLGVRRILEKRVYSQFQRSKREGQRNRRRPFEDISTLESIPHGGKGAYIPRRLILAPGQREPPHYWHN